MEVHIFPAECSHFLTPGASQKQGLQVGRVDGILQIENSLEPRDKLFALQAVLFWFLPGDNLLQKAVGADVQVSHACVFFLAFAPCDERAQGRECKTGLGSSSFHLLFEPC
ncbi:hypothetical protein VL04_04125 [Chromobacterium violaceum]|nr:hypothetical protein VL02_13395 [Chromobacterium violaceum]KMN91514.1 hypothetical protein VL04_04125 [Chromobacterium violaceum]KMO05698.1 hypothetical protein VL16_00840 [Chromobacterium violaceum]